MILAVLLHASVAFFLSWKSNCLLLHPKRYFYLCGNKRTNGACSQKFQVTFSHSERPIFFSCCFIHIWSELWVFRMYISQKPTLQECHRECALARLSNTLSVGLRKGNSTLLFTHFQFNLNTNWLHWKLIPREFTLQALHNFHYHSVDFSSFPLAKSPPSVLQVTAFE